MVRRARMLQSSLASSQRYDERRAHDSTRSEERAQRIRDAAENCDPLNHDGDRVLASGVRVAGLARSETVF